MKSEKNSKSLTDLVEEHVNHWESKLPRLRNEGRIPNIAISREEGTIAEEVAGRLADARGMHLFDEDLIHRIAQDAEVSEQMVRSLDEHGENYLENMFQQFLGVYGFTSDDYLRSLFRVVGTIDWHGNGIIIGRGASFILRRDKNLLVRFVEPIASRVKRLQADGGPADSEIRRKLERKDEDRRKFVHQVFNADIDEARNYDLVINSHSTDVAAATDLITRRLDALAKKATARVNGPLLSGTVRGEAGA